MSNKKRYEIVYNGDGDSISLDLTVQEVETIKKLSLAIFQRIDEIAIEIIDVEKDGRLVMESEEFKKIEIVNDAHNKWFWEERINGIMKRYY